MNIPSSVYVGKVISEPQAGTEAATGTSSIII